MLRSFDAADFPAEAVAASKRGRRVSVCIPARDEEATIAGVVGTIRTELAERHRVVDELVVVDDGSTDATAAAASAAGATVVIAADVLREAGGSHGKGQAMWKGLYSTSGDVVAFCDADIRGLDPALVLGVIGPLLARDDVSFVKGFYDRPLDGRPGEGGRVTELMAKPLLSVLFPHLAGLVQPLAGECAGTREVLESVPFVGGYGVDIGLVIDVACSWGVQRVAQCDLGTRVHRNRSLAELAPVSEAVLRTALARAGHCSQGAAPLEMPALRRLLGERRSA